MEHMDFATGKLTITENIYNQLLLEISNGTYLEGEKLPSESALCKQYKASRFSVRGALQRLEAIGVIETYQGRGSYVTGVEKGIDARAEHDGERSFCPMGRCPLRRSRSFGSFASLWQIRLWSCLSGVCRRGI